MLAHLFFLDCTELLTFRYGGAMVWDFRRSRMWLRSTAACSPFAAASARTQRQRDRDVSPCGLGVHSCGCQIQCALLLRLLRQDSRSYPESPVVGKVRRRVNIGKFQNRHLGRAIPSLEILPPRDAQGQGFVGRRAPCLRATIARRPNEASGWLAAEALQSHAAQADQADSQKCQTRRLWDDCSLVRKSRYRT